MEVNVATVDVLVASSNTVKVEDGGGWFRYQDVPDAVDLQEVPAVCNPEDGRDTAAD